MPIKAKGSRIRKLRHEELRATDTAKRRALRKYFDVQMPLMAVKDIAKEEKGERDAFRDYMDEKYGPLLRNAAQPALENAAQPAKKTKAGASLIPAIARLVAPGPSDAEKNKSLYGNAEENSRPRKKQ